MCSAKIDLRLGRVDGGGSAVESYGDAMMMYCLSVQAVEGENHDT